MWTQLTPLWEGTPRVPAGEEAPGLCSQALLGKACFGETSLAKTTPYEVPDAVPGTGSSQQRGVPPCLSLVSAVCFCVFHLHHHLRCLY